MRLTKTVVECLGAPAQGYTLHWDGELRGFGVRVTARGVKTFVLQRRVNGKDRRITIGRLGPLTAVEPGARPRGFSVPLRPAGIPWPNASRPRSRR
jgi:Arm domain-containing DNA-binding protein